MHGELSNIIRGTTKAVIDGFNIDRVRLKETVTNGRWGRSGEGESDNVKNIITDRILSSSKSAKIEVHYGFADRSRESPMITEK